MVGRLNLLVLISAAYPLLALFFYHDVQLKGSKLPLPLHLIYTLMLIKLAYLFSTYVGRKQGLNLPIQRKADLVIESKETIFLHAFVDRIAGK